MDSIESPLRETVPAADHPTGHDLIAIETWLPGPMPTEANLTVPEQTEYRTRFWRCRACGAERDRTEEFEAVCPGIPIAELVTDGGLDERASSEGVPVDWVRFGPQYLVSEPDGTCVTVNIESRSCRCPVSAAGGIECVHLEAVERAIHAGSVPWPDGSFVSSSGESVRAAASVVKHTGQR